MELRDLKTLIGIAESGSLSGAARKLNLTQPALSASLKRLEDELKVQLVARHSRGADVTEEGKFVLQKAYAILHDVADMTTVAQDLIEEPIGDVRLGLPTTVAGGITAELVHRLCTRHPLVRLHVIEAMSGVLVEQLQLGRLDMAILFDIQPMAGLRSEPILIEEPRLLVSGSHELASRKQIRLDELDQLELVMPSQVHSIRGLIDRISKSEGVSLKIVADVDSFPGIVSLVQKGYPTIFPTYLVREHIERGTIAAIPLVQPRIDWTLHLATRQDSVRPRASLATARLLIDLCSELVVNGSWPGRLHPRRAP